MGAQRLDRRQPAECRTDGVRTLRARHGVQNQHAMQPPWQNPQLQLERGGTPPTTAVESPSTVYDICVIRYIASVTWHTVQGTLSKTHGAVYDGMECGKLVWLA